MVDYLEKTMERLNFWRIKENLQKHFQHCHHRSDDKWKEKHCRRKRKQETVLMLQEQLFISELFRDIQGRNLIDPSLQDNVLIPNDFFEYIHHVGCAINFTFHHQFRIDAGRSKFEQTTDSILSACGSYG